MSSPVFLSKYRQSIISEMHHILDGSERDHLKMIYYHLGWLDKNFVPADLDPGKLSRPSLLLMTTEKLNGDMDEAIKAAAAIQIFHDFTLLHDDIEDNDVMRRHRETVWKLWGVPRAINAGDTMYTLSIQSLLRLGDQRQPVMEYLFDVFGELLNGQEMDLAAVHKSISEVSIKEYLETIGGKSAWLIGASCKVGAIIARADQKACDSFYRFGFNLGLAYQLYDDLVSVWGSEAKSGKHEYMDILEHKKTLPLLMLSQKADENDKQLFLTLFGREKLNKEDVAVILGLLEKYEIRTDMEEFINRFRDIALESIDDLGLDAQDSAEYKEIVGWLIPKGYK